MKKIILLTAVLITFSVSAQPPNNYNTITDVTFTDVDGQTHNLYNLLGQGYRVILDFGFIGCGPCSDWSQHIGPELWDEHGPDGDNTLRTFYFETGGLYTDDEVESYYTGLGVEYSITNLDFTDTVESQYQAFFDAGILDGGYPVHIYVCQDTTYRVDIGFAYPQSLYIAEHILDNSCNGQDVHYKDVAMVGLAQPFSYCSQSSGPISFIPRLRVYHNGGIEYTTAPSPNPPPQSEFSINDTFLVKTYINNTYLRTDTLDPNDWGDFVDFSDTADGDDNIGQGVDWSFFLPSLEAQANDSVKFELLYPEDSYMLNNTYSFKVEQEETKTASSNQFRLVLENPYMFVYLYAEGEVGGEDGPSQEINIQNGYDTLITINNGQCYAMSVVGVQAGNASLIQFDNNDTIFHRPIGGAYFESKLYYFNVDSTATAVDEYFNTNTEISHIQYFDLMGRLQDVKSYDLLAQGVYLRVIYYTDGTFISEKISKIIN
ncbi:MAG: hypothetical protein ISR00_00205 [Flavobacteriales bacterium]|nr:hypothetical protein [Flavobacteriales bacterium]